jgi:hypothetical protein
MTERGPDGKFIKGNSGNPGGRPKSDYSITALIDAAVGESDWIFIIGVLLKRARRGDVKAIEMLMDRRFGKAIMQIGGANGAPIPVQLIEVALPPEESGDSNT